MKEPDQAMRRAFVTSTRRASGLVVDEGEDSHCPQPFGQCDPVMVRVMSEVAVGQFTANDRAGRSPATSHKRARSSSASTSTDLKRLHGRPRLEASPTAEVGFVEPRTVPFGLQGCETSADAMTRGRRLMDAGRHPFAVTRQGLGVHRIEHGNDGPGGIPQSTSSRASAMILACSSVRMIAFMNRLPNHHTCSPAEPIHCQIDGLRFRKRGGGVVEVSGHAVSREQGVHIDPCHLSRRSAPGGASRGRSRSASSRSARARPSGRCKLPRFRSGR